MFTEVDTNTLMNEVMILRAKPARSPKITVMDAYLKPIAGVKVFSKVAFGLKGVEKPIGVTNTRGELTMPAVYHGGKYTFRAALLGYAPSGVQLPPVGSKSWIDVIEIVTEPATGSVSGKVVDAKGAPVAGAKVTTDFGPNALTNATGEFTLKQMPERIVLLDVRKGGLHGTNLDAKGRLIGAREPIVIR